MFSTTDLLVIISTVVLAIIVYYKWVFKHWERKGVAQIPPKIPFGNMENPLNIKIGIQFKIKQFYDELKSKGHKHGGFYIITKPVYLPIDPEYVKNIMTRDFQHFVNRGVYHNEKDDPLSAHLFSLEGQKWRHLRTKFTPTFTSGKMKMMFQTLVDCGEQLKEQLFKVQSEKQAFDIKETVACFTTDVIGSCAFGLECNSFKDPDAEFRSFGRKLFKPTIRGRIKGLLTVSFPELCKMFGVKLFPEDASKFFLNAVKNIVAHRENSNITRNDFVQILLELKNEKIETTKQNSHGALTIEEMAAQSFVFFVAGFETSSTTMTFCMFELAKNQVIQQKLRDEINKILKKHDDKLTYEGIMEMKYMGQVIDETLRKYPPVTTLQRICTLEYKMPGTDVVLETGTKVMIPTYSLQHDPEYYPDPDTFNPDRFTEENKAQRHPFTFLPFGEGPRNCIGLRFGLMQTKIGLALMLQNYKYTLNARTPVDMQFNPRSPLLAPKEIVLLDIHKIV